MAVARPMITGGPIASPLCSSKVHMSGDKGFWADALFSLGSRFIAEPPHFIIPVSNSKLTSSVLWHDTKEGPTRTPNR